MTSNWQSITADSCRPVYGFHDPEDGFVWSAHRFSLFFPAGGKECRTIVFKVYNPHGDLTLDCRLGDRSLAVTIPPGEQIIQLDADCSGSFVEFAITPQVLLGSDVRELGLMIRRVAWQHTPGPDCLSFRPRSPKASAPTLAGHDGLTRLGAAARTLGAVTLGSFLREGWFKTDWTGDAFHFQLHAPPWQTHDAEVACVLAINGRETTVRFHRHGSRPTSYRAVVPLRGMVEGRNSLLDVEDPLDIELRPNAIGRYRGQGVHWRGHGMGGLPDPVNMTRVAGPVTLENFLLHGASWSVKLERMVASLSPGGFAACRRIVDWGCGCGRIARHVPAIHRAKIVGFDIDPVNVAWCRKHVADMRFEHCTVDPPLALEDASVDVLFAHSVLTHLSEARQQRWLEEIHRVLRPGGLAFLTVLAELSWYERFYPHGRTPEAIAEYLEKGFVDHGWQQDVGVDIDCPGAYVQVSHGRGYVWATWSKLFEIIDWIDGFADLQSLVIVRK